ncbi:MAG TPA: molybdopterin cofactor-binding domain-containing protein [Paraburkholderia sp.]
MNSGLAAHGRQRRRLLQATGGLVIGFCMNGGFARAAGSGDSAARLVPTVPDPVPLGEYGPSPGEIDSWLSVAQDGTVTLYSGVCEIGTGSHTAILQIMADELDVSLAQTRMVTPDTFRTPDQFVSSGSRSVEYHAVPVRQAAAEARHALLELAAAHLDAPLDALDVNDGTVSVKDSPERRVGYGELIGTRRFEREVSGTVKPKRPDQYRIVGKPQARIDIPRKVTGQFTFMQDVRIPGMLHGRMVRPPSHGASVLAIDASSIAHLPGVVQIVRCADSVGVVCEREEQAIGAARALKVSWSDWAGLPAMAALPQALRDAPIDEAGIPPTTPHGIMVDEGDIATGFANAARTWSATYTTPYQLHGSIGPSCSIADVRADGASVWCGTQTPYGLREAVAKFLGMPAAQVRVIFVEASGCYGQNGADDVVIDALVLSRAVGRPVRVQWMRDDEMGWETYKTARVTDVRGALDGEGRIVAWESSAWGYSGYSRPEYHEPKHGGDPGSLVTAQLAGWDRPGVDEGFRGIAVEAVPYYRTGSKKVIFNYLGPASHRQGSIRMRVGSMRGVGSPDNLFAIESFIDELAFEAGADPIAFRLRHTHDARSIAVLNAVAERAGWLPRVAHSAPAQPGEPMRGRGIALTGGGRETHVATIFEVEVDRDSGAIRVPKVTIAFDCGLIVNPDGLRNQIEGGIIQGISRALLEEVKFDRSTVTSRDWSGYPIITFEDVPQEIDIVLIDRPEIPPEGAAEAPTENVWAGLANAVFDATGVRFRTLPLSRERVKQALRV